MNPNPSSNIPKTGHFTNTSTIPVKNSAVPLILRAWKKNEYVFPIPITSTTPDKNRIFPIASRPVSKNNNTPSTVKNTPNAVNPTPISNMNYEFNYEMGGGTLLLCVSSNIELL